MTIVFPRELPSYSLTKCQISIVENVAGSPSDNGTVLNLTQFADEVWKVDILSGLLNDDQKFEWSAWKHSLRGGVNAFLAYDLLRRRPRAYQDARQATDIKPGWNGLANVTSLGLAGALGLSALPANYIISAGDRVGLEQGGRYGYYEILETVTASAGGAATVTVAPFLHTRIFTTAAKARIWQPRCMFRLDWRSWSEEGKNEPSPVSFQGYQQL